MYKTITFAVDTKYNDPIQETFTFEQLGIDEQLSDIEMKKQIDYIFKNWVSDRLNISHSIVIETETE
ncbi:hypothetical protein U1P98_22180 [Lysinibacillus irui]|uniref:Uncharacterized protein n=1 Tax=Lysinibacillus irui TaxID=2998077 RepID=A0ABU5NSR7_9BACI|nr:hypothetical protein [Lysinibacillus irui]MEA0553231.1 hypothetical protein [Lysinibacillus irui]MEA0979009.1 hypothetical protein [Lysinibacillus irui]MEA1045163.1 hypothetical protein [Lysinibacillus irui]